MDTARVFSTSSMVNFFAMGQWLKVYEYIPKWLAIVIPFVIFYMQRKRQKKRRKPGELPVEIDWIMILYSFFSAISFAVLLTPNTDGAVRGFATFAFGFTTVALIYTRRR